MIVRLDRKKNCSTGKNGFSGIDLRELDAKQPWVLFELSYHHYLFSNGLSLEANGLSSSPAIAKDVEGGGGATGSDGG